MTFFVTSEPIGNGGNLGGLEGADAHCERLAQAVGAENFTWRAYLSTQARPGRPAVNARDRIGEANGVGVAQVERGIARPVDADRFDPAAMPGPLFRPSDVAQQERLAAVDFQSQVRQPDELDIAITVDHLQHATTHHKNETLQKCWIRLRQH